MITAPFNFVPLSEKVFFPDWAEKVSHDVPFEDAQSGVIDITIKAKSPIFIRDHEKQEEFCQHNGTHYIPSSSVKGMVRNVLEIMSFSKMTQVDDDTYTVRDLRNSELYMSKMTPDKTFCGFLKKVNGKYIIEDCGKPGRIKHSELDKIFNMDFASKFKQGKFKNKAKDKTAKVKYEMINSDNFVHGFEYVKKDVNREIYRYAKNSNKKGTLALTGQPSARKEPQGQKPSGKVYEFIFFHSKEELKLREEVVENFLFAYFDKRTTEPKESPDWTFWKKKLENGEKVPVFFQKNGKEVAHFGLSYLYKLPYRHSVKDGIPSTHNDSRKDLAQTIFGYIGKDEVLKGRVQFSHFKATSSGSVLNKRTEILGTPRASYYPMYVRQNSTDFTTFMNDYFSIAGWKRYPIHSGARVERTTDTGNENVGTTFGPLKEGVVFKGKLRYHNLRKAELGALLSSLTFHGTEGCFHNIGMAKSLGYGKIDIKIDGVDTEEYLKAFELEISTSIDDWAGSVQLKQLLSMASEQNNAENSALKYMKLTEFANCKSKSKDYLKLYTELNNIKTVSVHSLVTEEEREALKVVQAERADAEKVREEEKKRQEEEQKAVEEAQKEFNEELEYVLKTDNMQVVGNFIEKYPGCNEIAEVLSVKKKLDKIENDKKANKHAEVDAKAKATWTLVEKKKGNKKQFDKEKDKFLKKWKAEKNNKGSEYILELVKKLDK